MMTNDACELLINSYRVRGKYAPSKQRVTIMSIEDQTIGFIHNALNGVTTAIRQYSIGSYRVDMCLTEHSLVVECDEYGHHDRDPIKESTRESYILESGFMMIRFNPNDSQFDTSKVINSILLVITGKTQWSAVVMKM